MLLCTGLDAVVVLVRAVACVGALAPGGFFPFEEGPPELAPPKVARPPYIPTTATCPGDETFLGGGRPGDLPGSFCGDLNRKFLPRNPVQVLEEYPLTLEHFAGTLPFLKQRMDLPKVMRVSGSGSAGNASASAVRGGPMLRRTDGGKETRQLHICEGASGMLCRVYSMLTGKMPGRDGSQEKRFESRSGGTLPGSRKDPPPATLTPCPSTVEYVTPLYARNHHRMWRYVVQIPYEEYFTQTVEVTHCLTNSCYFTGGSCLSSPRWVSLLVAEAFYPRAVLPKDSPAYREGELPEEEEAPASRPEERAAGQNSPTGFESPQAPAETSGSGVPDSSFCDGYDALGCFQVRLYFDWFLVPGACKCWKTSYRGLLLRASQPEGAVGDLGAGP